MEGSVARVVVAAAAGKTTWRRRQALRDTVHAGTPAGAEVRGGELPALAAQWWWHALRDTIPEDASTGAVAGGGELRG
ncbi:hypothetical protein [Phytohabitans houttuyneae]|uniref:Uncharacterized protein n=1 Tax=Phytohabitans houttuyneae TaxID=1076126 RepID=A0A6V8KGB4_9ACTN|nr:hypothetical protein [Phytohabitans houttuyneae]GFJ84273.1 hypothetical protein Phou_084530 [Phytohabitans houttuyneae]